MFTCLFQINSERNEIRKKIIHICIMGTVSFGKIQNSSYITHILLFINEFRTQRIISYSTIRLYALLRYTTMDASC